MPSSSGSLVDAHPSVDPAAGTPDLHDRLDDATDAEPLTAPTPRVPGALLRPGIVSTRLDPVLDALDRWRSRPRAVAGGLFAIGALVLGGWWLLRPPSAPLERQVPMATDASSAVSGSAAAASTGAAGDAATPSTVGGITSTTTSKLVVAAAGAVARPGVYRLGAGARVDDLVRAAGGLAPGADGARLNLAAPLADGERVYVPKPGETPPAAVGGEGAAAPTAAGADDAGGGAAGTGAANGAAGTVSPSAPIDLNAATASQLDELPGVGPATAQAILTYRQEHGPFKTVDELLEVRGIGDAKLEQVRALVTVGG